MSLGSLRTTFLALGLAASAICAGSPALGQPGPDAGGPEGGPPPGDYQGGPDQDQNGGPDQGRYNVAPPPGYQSGDERYDSSPQARAQDDRYSYEAEQWAAHSCVVHRANDTAAGAVIGGLLGAIVGSGLSGRHEHAAGAIVGGTVGAVAGGAIGHAAGSSDPNCPPGYVLRDGAEPFYPGPVYGQVIYAAPPSYDPWIWYGNHWIYRPYPYHRYWYRTHRR